MTLFAFATACFLAQDELPDYKHAKGECFDVLARDAKEAQRVAKLLDGVGKTFESLLGEAPPRGTVIFYEIGEKQGSKLMPGCLWCRTCELGWTDSRISGDVFSDALRNWARARAKREFGINGGGTLLGWLDWGLPPLAWPEADRKTWLSRARGISTTAGVETLFDLRYSNQTPDEWEKLRAQCYALVVFALETLGEAAVRCFIDLSIQGKPPADAFSWFNSKEGLRHLRKGAKPPRSVEEMDRRWKEWVKKK